MKRMLILIEIYLMLCVCWFIGWLGWYRFELWTYTPKFMFQNFFAGSILCVAGIVTEIFRRKTKSAGPNPSLKSGPEQSTDQPVIEDPRIAKMEEDMKEMKQMMKDIATFAKMGPKEEKQEEAK